MGEPLSYKSNLRLSLHSVLLCRATQDLPPVWFINRTSTRLNIMSDYSKRPCTEMCSQSWKWCASAEAEPRALLLHPFQKLSEERGRGSLYNQNLHPLNLPSSLTQQPICPGIWGQIPSHLWGAGLCLQNIVWKQSFFPDGCSRISPVVKIPRPHARGVTMDSTALGDNKAELQAASQKLIADTDRLGRSSNNTRNYLSFC